MSIVWSMHDVMFGQAPCWSCCVLPTCALGGRIRWGEFALIYFYPSRFFFATFTFFFVQISLTILGRGAGLAAATVARQNLWQLEGMFSQLPIKLYFALQITKLKWFNGSQKSNEFGKLMMWHGGKYVMWKCFRPPFGPLAVKFWMPNMNKDGV